MLRCRHRLAVAATCAATRSSRPQEPLVLHARGAWRRAHAAFGTGRVAAGVAGGDKAATAPPPPPSRPLNSCKRIGRGRQQKSKFNIRKLGFALLAESPFRSGNLVCIAGGGVDPRTRPEPLGFGLVFSAHGFSADRRSAISGMWIQQTG